MIAPLSTFCLDLANFFHRKHTGERPFQCHCSRRFSRLDNLRQHAQTVHVNEEIPTDSLAATGTRFQRQIRTDRVRPPNHRARASTLSSGGGNSRGHSRNLSTSSIASTASSISTPDASRRRPPPLAMANDGTQRARLSIDTFNTNNSSPSSGYQAYSPTGYSTPTSATFSTGAGSPRFSSGLQSPIALVPRNISFGGSRTPGRRLSVPSSGHPFQSMQGAQSYPQPYFSPLPSSNASTFSGQNSMFASPTSSNFPESRRESAAEAEWRRRTWHPGTYTGLVSRPATSGLSYYQTPDAPQPAFSQQPAASQVTRLPGIESFDYAPPPRRQASPMQLDVSCQPQPQPQQPQLVASAESRPIMHSRDNSLHRDLNNLGIASGTPPESQQWAQRMANQGHHSSAQHIAATLPSQFAPQQQPLQPPPKPAVAEHHSEHPTTPRKTKRHGWYHGPTAFSEMQLQQRQRRSPEDSSSSEGVPTPGTNVIAEFTPAIVHANGMVESIGAPIGDEAHKVLFSDTSIALFIQSSH